MDFGGLCSLLAAAFVPYAIHAFDFNNGLITAVTVFNTPTAFPRFGLPATIEP